MVYILIYFNIYFNLKKSVSQNSCSLLYIIDSTPKTLSSPVCKIKECVNLITRKREMLLVYNKVHLLCPITPFPSISGKSFYFVPLFNYNF